MQLVGAAARGMDLTRACWLAFGSEGRSEQTIATDQDNGLVFASDDAERDRPALAGVRARGQRGARRLRLPAVQGQRDGQQPGVLPDAGRVDGSASPTGSSTARPRTCSTPASTSTCAPLAGDAGAGAAAARAASRAQRRARAALHQADGRQRAAQPRAAELARRASTRSDVDGREVVDLKLQRHGDLRRCGAPVRAGARRRRHRHARALRGGGAALLGVAAAGGRGLGRRLRVPADAAPAGAARAATRPRRAPADNPNLVDVGSARTTSTAAC